VVADSPPEQAVGGPAGGTGPVESDDERRSAKPVTMRTRLFGMRHGLAGQVLTFSAMLIPILLQQAEQVLVLVFASAISTLVGNAALLAYPFLYPVIRGPRMARTATVWSVVALSVVSAALLPLGVLESPLGLPRGTFGAAAALTFGLGVYSVVVTRLVRAGDQVGLGLARLYYGVGALLSATITSLLPLGPLGLSLGTSLASVAAAAIIAGTREERVRSLPAMSRAARRRLRRAYLSRTARPALASLANGWTVFLPGLSLAGLGAAAAPWAVISRICGGFATVLLQVLGPPLEAQMSRAVRDRDRATFTHAWRNAVLMGVATALFAVPTGIGLAVYASDAATVDEWLVPLSIASALFWGSLLATSVINRLPNYLGRHTARLVWDVGRAALVTAAFLAIDGVARLVVMGAVLAVSSVVLLPMSRWRTPVG
jgi:hypothetical protein